MRAKLEGSEVTALDQIGLADLVIVPGQVGDWEVHAIDRDRELVTLKLLDGDRELVRPPYGLRLVVAMVWKERKYPPTWNTHLRKVPA